MKVRSDWFRRWLLPGLAFNAGVIGGGYATGRELASFFLPSGPVGGLWAMLLSTVIWSVVCAVTFLLALRTESRDYRTFGYRCLSYVLLAIYVAPLLTLGVWQLSRPVTTSALTEAEPAAWTVSARRSPGRTS